MKNQKINIKIIFLVILALVLGYTIYNQQKTSSSLNSPNTPTQPQLLPDNLTEDERFILNPPPATSSAEVKQKHADTVAKLAKEGNTLEIKDCKPTPLVLQVKQGSQFTIKNKDNVQHRIIFDGDHIYELPTNNQLTIKADFKYGTGDYGYVCEGVGLTGFLHVIP